MPNRDEMLDILWSKEQIRDLTLRYCRAVDRGDMELLESVYHPDAIDEHGFNKSRTAREFLDAVPTMRPQMIEIQHNVTNHLITVDGDAGEGEVYVLAYHRFSGENGPTLLLLGARFLDKYARRNGEWRIAERVCVDDWTIVTPATEPAENAFTGALARGCAGQEDVSYRFFERLAKPPAARGG